jgi:hypothetical protein
MIETFFKNFVAFLKASEYLWDHFVLFLAFPEGCRIHDVVSELREWLFLEELFDSSPTIFGPNVAPKCLILL